MNTLRSLLILLALFSLASQTFAQAPAIEPDEIDVALTAPGTMVNLDFSPAQPGCEQAAASYLKPDLLVITTEHRWFGNIGGGYISYAALEEYFATLFGNVQGNLLRSTPDTADGAALGQGILATTTGSYTCLSYLNGTAMFWEVALYDDPAQTGWLMESIRWENLALNLGYQPNNPAPLVLLQPQVAQPQNQYVFAPNTPPAPITPQNLQIQSLMTLDSMEGYYLEPFAAVPNDGVPGEMGVNLGLNTCVNSATSFLWEGGEALFQGRAEVAVEPPDFLLADQIQWMEPVQGSLNNSLNTLMAAARANELPEPVMPEPISMTWGEPLIDLTDNMETLCELMRELYKAQHGVYPEGDCEDAGGSQSPVLEGFVGGQIPIGTAMTINSGPLCTINSTLNLDQIFVWWQVSFEANGETWDNVWLPESISIYRKAIDLMPLPEPTLHHFYLLTPHQAMTQLVPLGEANAFNPIYLSPRSYGFIPVNHVETASSPCEGVLRGRIEAGEQMHPFARLNVRDQAYGTVIGQVEPSQTLTAVSNSICLGGFRWVQAQDATGQVVGWLAESDASYYYLVPGRAPQPEVVSQPAADVPPPPAESGNPPPADESSAPPPPPVAEPAVELAQPTPEPAVIVIVEPTRVPDPTGGSSQPPTGCDPATGRGC